MYIRSFINSLCPHHGSELYTFVDLKGCTKKWIGREGQNRGRFFQTLRDANVKERIPFVKRNLWNLNVTFYR